MDSLTDEEICEVIKNYELLMKRVQEEISSSYVMLANLLNDSQKDCLIEAVSMPGEDGKRCRDLSGVIAEYERSVRNETDRLRAYIKELTERRDRMNRIIEAYRSLPVKEQMLMEKMLFSDKPATVAYEEAADEMDRSLSSVMRARRSALRKIRDNFGGKK